MCVPCTWICCWFFLTYSSFISHIFFSFFWLSSVVNVEINDVRWRWRLCAQLNNRPHSNSSADQRKPKPSKIKKSGLGYGEVLVFIWSRLLSIFVTFPHRAMTTPLLDFNSMFWCALALLTQSIEEYRVHCHLTTTWIRIGINASRVRMVLITRHDKSSMTERKLLLFKFKRAKKRHIVFIGS